MGPATRSASGVRSEINVTPLVDVCLVLLIIFMVVTPLIDDSRALLPETVAPSKLGSAERRAILVVEREGTVRLDERPVSTAKLTASLRRVRERDPSRALVVKADRRLHYATDRLVLRDAQAAGFSGAGLAVRQITVDASTRQAASS